MPQSSCHRLVVRIATALTLAVLAVRAAGQSEPTATPEPRVELSPFTVSSTRDRGYVATHTLAGSRLNTELLTTPAAVSVFTRDFLNDIAAGDVMEAALYALNATPQFQNSPSANFEANIFGNTGVSFRGFVSGTATRNFFPWSVASDSYNVERLDFARGPNSILFGTGTPGGIVNTTTKRANFNGNLGAVSARVGTRDAYRATLDWNQILWDQKLAARVNAVWDESDSWVNYGFTKRRGIHGAVTFQPFRDTTIRLDAEHLEQDRNIARRFPLLDYFSGWSGHTIPQARGPLPEGDSTVVSMGNVPILIYDTSSGRVMDWGGMAMTDTDRGSVLEPTILRHQNFNGPDDRNDTRGRNFSVFVEQRLFDKLFIEAAYNKMDYAIDLNRPFLIQGGVGGGSYQVRIDPNQQLPNGEPNPNVGQPFVQGNWQKIHQELHSDDYRLTASYELDLGPAGRHQIAGLLGRREENSTSETARQTDFNRTAAPNLPITNDAHRVYRRVYLKTGDDPEYTARDTPNRSPHVDVGFLVWQGGQLRDEILRQDYQQISMVSRLIDDRLTLIGGLRRDEFRTRRRAGRAQDERGSFYITGDYGDFGPAAGQNTTTYGATFKIIEGLYAYANKSENFNNQSNMVPVIGSDGRWSLASIPPRAGEGTDYGFRFRALDGRVQGSVGYYETAELNRTFFWFGTLVTQTSVIVNLLEPGAYTTAFQDTTNTEGEGYEFEVTANLTDQWRLTFNAAKKRTVLSNQGQFYKGLYAQKRDEWLAQSGGPLDPDGRVETAIMTIDPIIDFFVRDGQRQLGESEYTANLFTNYEFAGGSMLSGLSIGGGIRYLGPAVIGYDDANADGVVEEYRGDSDYTVDFTAGYRWQLRDRRELRFQLNVRDLLQNDMVQRVGIISQAYDQEGGTILYKNPREIFLTATYSF